MQQKASSSRSLLPREKREPLVEKVLMMSRSNDSIEKAMSGGKVDKELARLASLTRKDVLLLNNYFQSGKGVALFVNGNLESKEYGSSRFITFPLNHPDPPEPGDLLGADSSIGKGEDVMCVSVISEEGEVEEFIRARLNNFL